MEMSNQDKIAFAINKFNGHGFTMDNIGEKYSETFEEAFDDYLKQHTRAYMRWLIQRKIYMQSGNQYYPTR